MDLGIRGRRALVGGASSGLGRAVAERLAAEGCDLAISARRAALLEDLAAELVARHGVRAIALPADLADPAAPAALAAAAVEALGGIDILVLNAGGPPPSDPTRTDAAGWAAAFQLLATSPIELASALLPGMRKRGWGRVVSIGSYAIRQPIEELVYSNAGRSALVAWLKTVSRVVAPDGVTVNGAFPGRHATPRIEQLDRATAERTGRTLEEVRAGHLASIPAGRYGQPDEFAGYVAWLCSEPAAYQTGTFTSIDGGIVIGLP
ncbi:MAG: SDR family oxidoreductase [Chloroflexota bacterium]|nr:MAG: SDR family oxidoreductase [Chloroflexota bacterium]